MEVCGIQTPLFIQCLDQLLSSSKIALNLCRYLCFGQSKRAVHGQIVCRQLALYGANVARQATNASNIFVEGGHAFFSCTRNGLFCDACISESESELSYCAVTS